GDPAPAAPPGPTWALWKHEVVELFLLGADQRYLEIEVGPRGHHLALQLEGARNIVACCLPLDVHLTESGPPRWRLQTRIPRDLLPPGPHRANATAIHGLGAARRYLAWTPVPGPRPDFHRLSCFQTVDLPGSRVATRPD
ncbi:MAG: hypothetical protein GXP62_07440, partial [Oligoflexia bacterium]|nr:hypothetical protein [Oligoflexia bacterium]